MDKLQEELSIQSKQLVLKKAKTANILTSIPVIIKTILLLICAVGFVILTIAVGSIEGITDTNGGGWILFFILLLSIMLIPLLGVYVLELILLIISVVSLKSNHKKSTTLCVVNSILNLLEWTGLDGLILLGLLDNITNEAIMTSIVLTLFALLALIQLAIVTILHSSVKTLN